MPEKFLFEFYVCYDHPAEYPEHYIVRRMKLMNNGLLAVVDDRFFVQSKNLEEIRHMMMVDMGLETIPHVEGEDAVILEKYARPENIVRQTLESHDTM